MAALSGGPVNETDIAAVIDARQLTRIEAVHRGFLYQHLYAAICLLKAGSAGVLRIVAERDEDIELVLADRRVYVQIKTRVGTLAPGDVSDALDRIEEIRAEHAAGRRTGAASFVIASNAPPSPSLAKLISGSDWPDDVAVHWPDGPEPSDAFLPIPPVSVPAAITACSALATDLPFALLRPETLTWKLASMVMFASAGAPPREDHSFAREELPGLFEQLVVHMQDLPAPPAVYRAQIDEPPLLGEDRVRIVAGLSGAGKTAWVAEAALHAPTPVAYLDVTDTPGPALASAVAREVAGRMFGRSSGALGEILLPGASGLDMIGALSVKLGEQALHAHVVIDNAHRVPVTDIEAIVARAPHVRFLLLCQPVVDLPLLESALGIRAETLSGWDEDTIAAAAAEAGCSADFAAAQRLSRLTGGLPFYVLNAAAVAAREYGGDVDAFCADVEGQTHIVETAQELILKRAFAGLPDTERETVAILSLADVALSRDEAIALLRAACDLDLRTTAARLRHLPATGALELFGTAGLKIHDAVRVLARTYLAERGTTFEQKAKGALLKVIIGSIRRDWSIAKLGLLIRLFGQAGDARFLVQFATDELFHEMGVWPEIEPYLLAIAGDGAGDPETRLWALDGLVFNDLREGDHESGRAKIDAMHDLLEGHDLGEDEWLAWGMKQMLLFSMVGDADGVEEMLGIVEKRLPQHPEHLRIFRYNRALAFFKLDRNESAVREAHALIEEYYGELGITPNDVLGRNARELRPMLPKGRDLTDTLKHLADTLDLLAQASGKMGARSPMARIHAMKFYELAHAFQSFVRVGQDLVDEFVWVHDFTGAREILERNIFPTLQAIGLVSWVLPVRALYAVVLAYCGDHQAAANEVARLRPYEEAMADGDRQAFREQKRMIVDLRRFGGPQQRRVDIPAPLQALFDQRRGSPAAVEPRRKVGRNERCPCGSGRKYKQCHGR
jgi:hypothetical protein